MERVPVVILCGGLGTRLREETEFKPKPMVTIGDRPILWHIMKTYSHYGFRDFILCLGYKNEVIRDYFLNYRYRSQDFSVNLKYNAAKTMQEDEVEDWNIILADTGAETQTGGRIKRIQKYIKSDYFLATYGDGVSDVDIKKLVEFHKQKGKLATLTGLHPRSKYGTVSVDHENIVTEFKEKPILKDLINGGFFVFNKEVFNYLDEHCVLEEEPFENLARDRQVALFRHEGYWQCMDTFKDAQTLNKIWKTGEAPWKVWR